MGDDVGDMPTGGVAVGSDPQATKRVSDKASAGAIPIRRFNGWFSYRFLRLKPKATPANIREPRGRVAAPSSWLSAFAAGGRPPEHVPPTGCSEGGVFSAAVGVGVASSAGLSEGGVGVDSVYGSKVGMAGDSGVGVRPGGASAIGAAPMCRRHSFSRPSWSKPYTC